MNATALASQAGGPAQRIAGEANREYVLQKTDTEQHRSGVAFGRNCCRRNYCLQQHWARALPACTDLHPSARLCDTPTGSSCMLHP